MSVDSKTKNYQIQKGISLAIYLPTSTSWVGSSWCQPSDLYHLRLLISEPRCLTPVLVLSAMQPLVRSDRIRAWKCFLFLVSFFTYLLLKVQAVQDVIYRPDKSALAFDHSSRPICVRWTAELSGVTSRLSSLALPLSLLLCGWPR